LYANADGLGGRRDSGGTGGAAGAHGLRVLEVIPVGDFSTYGVGVGRMKMIDHMAARGHAPVGG
jgi:hypothetical protein